MPHIKWSDLPWRTILLVGALIAYYLPWLSNAAAALSGNAYDLAESVSLNPVVRDASIPYLAPFLMRAVLGGIALLFCLRALQVRSVGLQLAFAAVALLLAVTLLPPLEFFRGALDDANYRQQFVIAVGTLGGLVALTAVYRQRLFAAWKIELVIAVLTILFAIAGELLALNAVSTLRIAAPMGIGVVLLVVCLGLFGVLTWRKAKADA